MTRRHLLQNIVLQNAGLAAAAKGLLQGASKEPIHALAGTQPLTWEGDLSERMMDGAHRYVEQKIAESIKTRQKYWKRDLSSRAAYEKSVEPNRGRFSKQI